MGKPVFITICTLTSVLAFVLVIDGIGLTPSIIPMRNSPVKVYEGPSFNYIGTALVLGYFVLYFYLASVLVNGDRKVVKQWRTNGEDAGEAPGLHHSLRVRTPLQNSEADHMPVSFRTRSASRSRITTGIRR